MRLRKKIAFIQDEVKNDLMLIVANRGPGETFGDLALRFDASRPNGQVKRAATVMTVEDSIFGVIDKKTYQMVLEKIEAR